MQDKIITLVVFISTLFLFIQIRLVLRFRKFRKESPNLPGILFLSEIEAGFAICFQCCACLTGAEEKPYVVSDYETKVTGIQETIKDDEIDEKYRISEEQREENKVKVLIHGMPSISIETACKMTKLTKKRIKEIIAKNPDYLIEDENIINLKTITDEKVRRKRMLQVQGICGNCENPFEPGSEFCPNCGQAIK